jgi:membrane protease YdiL (CAAX protease family)
VYRHFLVCAEVTLALGAAPSLAYAADPEVLGAEPAAIATVAPQPTPISNTPSPTRRPIRHLLPPEESCGTIAAPTCSLFWLSLGSFMLPGLGQGVDGRTWLPYSVIGAAGWAGTIYLGTQHRDEMDLDDRFDTTRSGQAMDVAMNTAFTAGALSAYETYRHRVVDRMGFRTERFRPVHELLLAPVHFESVTHWPVILNLVAVSALSGARLAGGDGAFINLRARDIGSGLFSSVGAGVWEESFYRGFLMSYLEHRWGWNRWLANGTQAAFFGVSHGGVDLRMLFGLFDGWMAQANDYDLTDNIFAHTWWDIIVTAVDYATTRDRKAIVFVLPAIPF